MPEALVLKPRDARAIYLAKKPMEEDYLKRDSAGLFLLIKANGEKKWLYNYCRGGFQSSVHIGAFPKISVSMARKIARAYRGRHPRYSKEVLMHK